MKKLITFNFLFTLAISAIAQVDSVDYYKGQLIPRTTAKDRVSASVLMGASVGFSNLKSAPVTSGTYIASMIGYQLTPKFKLNMGVLHYTVNGNSYVPITLSDNKYPTGRQSYSGNLLMLGGQYLVNNKLMFSGDLMYDTNPLLNKQHAFKAASLGLDYKVSSHATFSVKTILIQSNGSNLPLGPSPMVPMGTRSTLFNTFPTNVSPGNF